MTSQFFFVVERNVKESEELFIKTTATHTFIGLALIFKKG